MKVSGDFGADADMQRSDDGGHDEARSREALSTACPDCDRTNCMCSTLLETWRNCPRCQGTGYVRKSELTPEELTTDDARVVPAQSRAATQRRVSRESTSARLTGEERGAAES